MNAKEYYFSVIAPNEKNRNYSSLYHNISNDMVEFAQSQTPGLTDFTPSETVYNHVPDRSNDYLIEQYMNEFIKNTKNDLRSILENLFVAKSRNYYANASISINQNDFTGGLIIFNVGLSDACLQYTSLLAELQELLLTVNNSSISGSKKFDQAALIFEKAIQIKLNQDNWEADGNFIRFHKEFTLFESTKEITERACQIASYTDKYILGHEIGHYLLHQSHTKSIIENALNYLPIEIRLWESMTSQHAEEIKADVISFLLVSGLFQSNLSGKQSVDINDDQISMQISAILGSLITLLLLGQLHSDVNQESNSHPSCNKRFIQLLTLIDYYCSHDYIVHALNDIFLLSAILYISQSKGYEEIASIGIANNNNLIKFIIKSFETKVGN